MKSCWVGIVVAVVCVACRTPAPGPPDEVPVHQSRAELIDKLQAFISAHPEHPPFTPDAMFRLADLLTDEAEEEEESDYSEAIEVLFELTARFPGYERRAEALYLLGYCLIEQGRFDNAKEVYERFMASHSDSSLASEVQLRLGEMAFDEMRLDEAISAYRAVLASKETKWRDKALYKLAWTHYRLDQYPEAIEVFSTLVEEADRGEGDGVLRAEAIQYIAIALVEPDWDNDGNPDAGCKPPAPDPWAECDGAPTSEIGCRVHRYLSPKATMSAEVLGKAAEMAAQMEMKGEGAAISRMLTGGCVR